MLCIIVRAIVSTVGWLLQLLAP